MGHAKGDDELNAGMNDIYTYVDEDSPSMVLIRTILDEAWNGQDTPLHRRTA
jgi:hypothetical protein